MKSSCVERIFSARVKCTVSSFEEFKSRDSSKWATEPLEVYGPCISTASAIDWPRHRKVLATPFNENIMRFVWDESLHQARDMLEAWTSSGEPQVSDFAKDTRTLSLNVLAATGFQHSYKFRSSSSQPGTDEVGSYRDALQTVLDNAITLMVVSPRLLQLPLLPGSWTRIGKAAAEFRQYMVHMLDEETFLLRQGKMGTGSLMTSFVRALDTRQEEESAANSNKGPPKGMTIDEIFGNIFVINFAGHDTTANTLAFSMLQLAANPEVQDWVSEEVQEITGNKEKWDYNELFSSLKRCRAVLVRITLPVHEFANLTCIARDPSPLSTDHGTP